MQTRIEGTFQTGMGSQLYYQCWQPDGPGKAVLAIVHGWGEHSGRYRSIATYMVEQGYVVYIFDNQGHGRSPGQRGHIEQWSEYRSNVHDFLGMIRNQQTHYPIFLMGHSMGALIVLDYSINMSPSVEGIIASATPTEPAGIVNKTRFESLTPVFSRLWPSFSVSLKLDKAAISRDPDVIDLYKTDPYVHDKVTARWGTESLSTVKYIKENMDQLQLPVLFLHGEKDRLALASGSQRLFNEVCFADKEIHIYPGRYHEVHNDLGREQMLADLRKWTDRQLLTSIRNRSSIQRRTNGIGSSAG